MTVASSSPPMLSYRLNFADWRFAISPGFNAPHFHLVIGVLGHKASGFGPAVRERTLKNIRESDGPGVGRRRIDLRSSRLAKAHPVHR